MVSDAVLENALAIVVKDRYPVSEGHMLVATRRHVADYFDTTPEERKALEDLLFAAKKIVDSACKPDGYNVGINVGHAAGQTVLHVHIHLIPRYRGDVPHARGGVRGVIPSKQNY